MPDKDGFVHGCWGVACGLERIMLKLVGRPDLRDVFLGVDCETATKSVAMDVLP